MKKNGFTLTDLLVSLAILGILILISMPAVKNIYKNIKTKNQEASKALIINAAKVYGEDNKEDLFERVDGTYRKCIIIEVDDLIKNGYYDGEEVNEDKVYLQLKNDIVSARFSTNKDIGVCN